MDDWGNPDGFLVNFHRPDYPNTPVSFSAGNFNFFRDMKLEEFLKRFLPITKFPWKNLPRSDWTYFRYALVGLVNFIQLYK